MRYVYAFVRAILRRFSELELGWSLSMLSTLSLAFSVTRDVAEFNDGDAAPQLSRFRARPE